MQIKPGIVLSVFCLVWAGLIGAEPVQKADVQRAVEQWIQSSSHFKYKKTPFVRASFTVRSVEKITLEKGTMPLYAVTLDPAGYVVMNSDKRLPPIIAYSETGDLNLNDLPQNTSRALLKRSMKKGMDRIVRISAAADGINGFQSLEEEENVLKWERLLTPEDFPNTVFSLNPDGVGPFLTTLWNQNNHYNELCPEDPEASAYYDGHVPVGCVAVVGAQIMNFYQWPYRGSGRHSYTDSEGDITGAHSAVFSDTYDWNNMQDSYYAWGSEPQAAVDAVSELMYETGVAVEMDYESGGSSSLTYDLMNMMYSAFLYEKGDYLYDESNPQSVADQLRPEMLAGRPAVLSIPGHAVVADGFRDEGMGEFFHANYGWGGSSNEWYLIDALHLGPGDSCVTGLYPAMMPVNVTESGQTCSSPNVALQWTLADVRTAEVQSVSVLSHVLQTNTFSDPCEDFLFFSDTSTDQDDYPWTISSDGYSGNGFRKESPGWSNREYHLTSAEKFVPKNGSRLRFRLKTHLSSDVFRVMVSSDDGQTFSEIGSYDPGQTWTLITVDLSAYEGSEILIRFEYVPGGYFTGGGVWLDSISYTDGSWYDWETLQSFASVSGGTVSNLSEGTNTLALQAYDGSAYGGLSPSFSVVVQSDENDEDADGLPNDWELQYYGGTTNADPAAMAANGVNTVMDAYIAGLNPTNPASLFKAAVTNQNGFVVQWNAASGRVYSVLGSTNLQSGFQAMETNILWPQSSWTDTVERSEQFYQVDVEMAE